MHTKTREENKRIPTVTSIYNAYVKTLKEEFRPTPIGSKFILSALQKGYAYVLGEKVVNHEVKETKEHVESKRDPISCTEICPKPETHYENQYGAVFLSLCTVSHSLIQISDRHPFILSVLIYAAKEMGVGELLQRPSDEDCSLFRSICLFPSLAIRLLHEPQDSSMFPNLTQKVKDVSLIYNIFDLGNQKLTEIASDVLSDQYVNEAIHHLIQYNYVTDDHAFLLMLRRTIMDPGILFMSMSTALDFITMEFFTHEEKNIRSLIIELYRLHFAYNENILPLLAETLGSSLLYISSLYVLIKQYLYVKDL